MSLSNNLKKLYEAVGYEVSGSVKNIYDVNHFYKSETSNNDDSVNEDRKYVELVFLATKFVSSDDITLLLKKLQKNFQVRFRFTIQYDDFNPDMSTIIQYWNLMKFWLPNLYKEVRFVDENQFNLSNDLLSIDFKVEQTYQVVNNELVNIVEHFKRFGFSNLTIKINKINIDHLGEDLNEHISTLESIKKSKESGSVISIPLDHKSYKQKAIADLTSKSGKCTIVGVVGGEVKERKIKKSGNYVYGFSLVNYKHSIKVATSFFSQQVPEFSKLKQGMTVRLYGKTKYNEYWKKDEFVATFVEKIDNPYNIHKEKEEIHRIELHTHTKMSTMDGIDSAKSIIERASKLGHEAVAITDHNSVQSFPEANYASKATGVKLIYGLELDIVDTKNSWVVKNPDERSVNRGDFVFFDLETTSLNSFFGDIIEIGAVKYDSVDKMDSFQTFAKPKRPLTEFTTNLTGISNDMVDGAPTEEEAIRRFADFVGDATLVAHNAEFDYSYLKNAYLKYGLGEVKNPVIDTLKLAWELVDTKRFNLGSISKKLGIHFDTYNAHRADYDAERLAEVYWTLESKIRSSGAKNLIDIEDIFMPRVTSKLFSKHVNIIAKNEKGLKKIFDIVSDANTKYLTPKGVKYPLEKLLADREDILIGSGCSNSLVWSAATTDPSELENTIKMFDYVEVQHPRAYDFLVHKGNMTEIEIRKTIQKIVETAALAGVPVVATGDVHLVDMRDKIARDVIIHSSGKGGSRNPLFSYSGRIPVPDQSFKTTREMIESFAFLGEKIAKEITITNTNLISSMTETYSPIKKELYKPEFEEANKVLMDYAKGKLEEYYGGLNDEKIKARWEKEVNAIVGNNFDVFYYLVHKIVKKSLSDNYLVGSRGSVGSSLFAWLTDITEVNPLEAHYVCKNCKEIIWKGDECDSGLDLPSKKCEKCHNLYEKQGYNIPFETFLGFDGTKVPDIDLNFSGVYQSKIHDYTRTLFPENKVFRAGTISTVADKTAFGYVKNYFESIEDYTDYSNDVIGYIASKITGVKRTIGSHPGGLIIVPDSVDITDFTPINYSGDDIVKKLQTTHFDYHAIDANLLKLDLLGHDDPTFLRDLYDYTGIDPRTVPMDDPQIIKMFYSTESLGIDSRIFNVDNVGILGIPEFGTDFARALTKEAGPRNFADLIRISGLSHGTDVWTGNARNLVDSEVATLKEVISCRDDIMNYLINKGMEPSSAFTIMEKVRKGIPLTDEHIKLMRDNQVPEWYIESTRKIKYLFPKAHASAYVLMALKISWYKVHKPLAFYAAFFKNRVSSFDLKVMLKGGEAIKAQLERLDRQMSDYSITPKDAEIRKGLQLALEMVSRGYTFSKMDIEKVSSDKWIIDEDSNSLMPPLNAIEGLGESVGLDVEKQREIAPFTSKKDLLERTKLGKKMLPVLEELGALENLGEESNKQLTLF